MKIKNKLMCFYNSMSAKAIRLAARYGRKSDIIEIWKDIIEEQYVIPAYNEPDCAIITTEQEIQIMKWGLIPNKTLSALNAQNIIKKNLYKNARSETIFKTWPYKFIIKRQRCLIPSTGYFEYHYTLNERYAQPFFLYLKEKEIFSMAGTYDTWVNPETGEQWDTFTQITTNANELAEKIHNGGKNPFRMPVILRENDEERWLAPDLPEDDIQLLMKPYPSDKMEAYPVTRDFKDIDSRNPEARRPLSI